MWGSKNLKKVLVLMILDLLIYYGDEQILTFLGFPIDAIEENILDNITLGILLTQLSQLETGR